VKTRSLWPWGLCPLVPVIGWSGAGGCSDPVAAECLLRMVLDRQAWQRGRYSAQTSMGGDLGDPDELLAQVDEGRRVETRVRNERRCTRMIAQQPSSCSSSRTSDRSIRLPCLLRLAKDKRSLASIRVATRAPDRCYATASKPSAVRSTERRHPPAPDDGTAVLPTVVTAKATMPYAEYRRDD
jgi:hypothetical protein